MYDLAVVNSAPGACEKCRGSGVYNWGPNGKHSGTCFSCRGTGKQSNKQRARNSTYNKYKVARILSNDFILSNDLIDEQLETAERHLEARQFKGKSQPMWPTRTQNAIGLTGSYPKGSR